MKKNTKLYLKALLLLVGPFVFGQIELRYQQNETLEYDAVIQAYAKLDAMYDNALLLETGMTDSGRPLHLFLMQREAIDPDKSLEELRGNKAVLLVNNGIHPGESCGIDASIDFSQKLLAEGVQANLLVAIIPVYNVGGALNRDGFSRANQDGPKEHGFRGNAQNLDLNRDFIKADALNTRSFYAIFHALDPHIFVDTHTSNGADYQYVMTLISTQKDKLAQPLAKIMTEEMEPYLYSEMEKSGWEMTPYVNVFGTTPNDGFSAFLETPRYASGYTALHNTIGFITEAHMLKPYPQRVEATEAFLRHISSYASKNAEKLSTAKAKAYEADQQLKSFDIAWELDTTDIRTLSFKGYAYSYDQSALGDFKQLHYHRDKPETFEVNYFPSFKATQSASVPEYYVVPQAWREVIELLQYNQVQMEMLPKDTLLEVNSTYIDEFEFLGRPYEGHFLLKDMKTSNRTQTRQFFAGDYLISTDQPAVRFIVSVLEPEAVDSYLRWNFFDPIFQQKEYFSAYVFEKTASTMLENSPALQKRFAEWKEAFPEMAKNPYAVLEFFYKQSPYYEEEHLRYPVARIYSQ